MSDKNVDVKKEEIRKYNREYYQRNRKHLLEKQKEKNRRHLKRIGEWLSEYKKGLACIRCSESHPATLQFHHRDPKEKEFSIGEYRRGKFSRERILKEIGKCDVICANCHSKEHWSYLYE